MNILFLAPLPPPITGHSIVSKVLLDHLRIEHNVRVVDLSLGSSNDGSVTYLRSIEVLKVLFQVLKERRSVDAIYLTISESLAGNLKDLFIYLICADRLDRIYIHLHGGSIKKLLFDVHPIIRWLNSVAIHRMAGIIISGPSHAKIFSSMTTKDRIHIIPNFAQEYIFVNVGLIHEKFSDLSVLRLLYISGMTVGKGYLHLLDAYESLDQEIRKMVRIDFAGKFDTEGEREEFVKRITGMPSITYHGLVDEGTKQSLFSRAHIFCLPTTFFEGQPISILEAYASGCVVITAGQDGIRDVFTSGINGYEIEPREPKSTALIIERILSLSANLVAIAHHNWTTAMLNYRANVFANRVTEVLALSANSNR